MVRPSLGLGTRTRAILKTLQPFVLDRRDTAAWPGTRFINETVWVSRFRLTPESVTLLKTATARLYARRQPELPEDPAFLRGDGTTWLASIAHERDVFLELSADELHTLRAALPQLTLRADYGDARLDRYEDTANHMVIQQDTERPTLYVVVKWSESLPAGAATLVQTGLEHEYVVQITPTRNDLDEEAVHHGLRPALGTGLHSR